jgi:hypothetical protein
MRNDVFAEYYKILGGIVSYKETDENGNERKCTVSVAEAEKNPDRYKIYTCQHPCLQKKQFAYDTELVKKQEDKLRYLCSIVPQKKLGLTYNIWLKELLPEKSAKNLVAAAFVGETFLALAKECDLMRFVGPAAPEAPYAIKRSTKRRY